MFGVSGGDATPAFEMQECVLDQMPQYVKFLVVRSLGGSVVSGRDHRFHALACSLIDDRIAVVAFISDQMLGRDAGNQAASLRTIRCGTLCNNDSEWQIMRIHGQMYLGVEPPFVRLIS